MLSDCVSLSLSIHDAMNVGSVIFPMASRRRKKNDVNCVHLNDAAYPSWFCLIVQVPVEEGPGGGGCRPPPPPHPPFDPRCRLFNIGPKTLLFLRVDPLFKNPASAPVVAVGLSTMCEKTRRLQQV